MAFLKRGIKLKEKLYGDKGLKVLEKNTSIDALSYGELQ
jgi:hypothetical protein